MYQKSNYPPRNPASSFTRKHPQRHFISCGAGLARRKVNNKPANMRPEIATPNGHAINMRPEAGLTKAMATKKNNAPSKNDSHHYPPFAVYAYNYARRFSGIVSSGSPCLF